MKLNFLDSISEVWIKRIVVALRILIGAIFVFSGLVKGIDVWGVFYKIQDYLVAFDWKNLLPYTNVATSIIPLFEFLFGFLLMIGTFRKWSVILLLALMGFMLPLSLYIAIFNPVADCGCFGEAVVISNTATFVKNIFITLGLVFLFLENGKVKSLYHPVIQWLSVVVPVVFLLIVMSLGYFVQPLVDFRPYKLGTSLSNTTTLTDDTEFLFIYEKDGVKKEFTIEELPEDTAWVFVDRKEIKKETSAEVVNHISFYDENGDVVEDDLLSQGAVALLLVPDIDKVNVASTFNINDLHDLSKGLGVETICLTSGSESEIREWRELSLADYPIFTMDDSLLKSMARGNPALVRLSNGKIIWKVTVDCVDVEDLTDSSYSVEIWIMQNGGKVLVFLAFLALLLLGFLYLINKTPLLIKLGRTWHKKKKTNTANSEKTEA